MHKVFRYRLYPTRSQIRAMERTLEVCRWVYNETLAYRKTVYETESRTPSLYETVKLLPGWKSAKPELKSVFSQVLQEVPVRVDLSFKAFFRRVKNGEKPGYPRFKGRWRYDSFTYTQLGFAIRENAIHLSKIGDVYAVLHRPVTGTVKRVTVSRSATGKWYANLTVEMPDPDVELSVNPSVGIDVGLESFATLSNGEKIANPRFYRKEERDLARAQRRFSKTEKGSAERRTARKVCARIHERIGWKRLNFVQKVSRSLVTRFGVIAFEDLRIKNMLKNPALAKSISDAAWGMLVQSTRNKAAEAGSMVVLVDPRNTSKMCSRCGQLVEKSLSDRTHRCPECGLVLDRDENAAINILRLGLQSVRCEPDRSPRL